MKFKLKKWLYLINDATNLLLKKDQEKISGKYDKLKKILALVLTTLIISLAVNLYLLGRNF